MNCTKVNSHYFKKMRISFGGKAYVYYIISRIIFTEPEGSDLQVCSFFTNINFFDKKKMPNQPKTISKK